MAHFDVANWVLPALGMATAGIVALVRLWGRMAIQEQRSTQQGEEFDELKRRVDTHEERLGRQDTALARIEEGINYLKTAFDRAIGK